MSWSLNDNGVLLDDPAYRDGEVIGVYSGEYAVPWCMEKILDYWRHTYDNFPTYITGLGMPDHTNYDLIISSAGRVCAPVWR